MQNDSYAPITLTIRNLYNNQIQILHLTPQQVQILRESLKKTGIFLAETIEQASKIQDNRILING